MSEEFIPRTIPRVKVALYGPTNVGKTLFRNVLLRKDTSPPKPTEMTKEEEVMREYKKPTEFGTTMSIEKYKLTLVDVPGRPEFKQIRIETLNKIVGWLFMYDATDPSSAEKLMEMIKTELEPARKLKSAIAMMVVGTKKDLGTNDEAVKKGAEIAEYLSKHTTMLYGYSVPHVVISCTDTGNVTLTFLCIEAINFDLRPPKEIISRIMEGEAPLTVPSVEIEVPKEVKVPEKPAPVEPLIEEVEVEKMEVPEAPEPKEPVLEEPLGGLEEVGGKEEVLPEVPSPVEVMREVAPEKPKIEEVAPKPTKPKVVPREVKAKPIRIELGTDEKAWNLARKIKEKIPMLSGCYLISWGKDAVHVALDSEKKLTEKNKEFVRAILSLYNAIRGRFDVNVILLGGEEKGYGITIGDKIIVMEFDPKDISDMMMIFSAFGYKKPTMPIGEAISPKPVRFVLNKTDKFWDAARSIKNTSADIISCYIVIPENGGYAVAHDSDEYLAKEQEEFLSTILNIMNYADKITKTKLLMLVGKQSIIVAKKKGYIVIKTKGRPPTHMLRMISAAK